MFRNDSDSHAMEFALNDRRANPMQGSASNYGRLPQYYQPPAKVACTSRRKLKRVPSFLLGRPLQDYDATPQLPNKKPVPSDDTFLIIRRFSDKSDDVVYRFNRGNSLWFFGCLHPLRQFTINITTNTYFELSAITIILINCVFLALDNPPEAAEYVFAALYTVEMILKVISRGFILHSYAYLRDPWNWLDFFVVILGYVTLMPNMANLSGIRTFRVLRALRTISALRGLRTMVNTLLNSLKLLRDVLVLFLFFLCVMALIGLQLFVGQLHNKCVSRSSSNANERYVTNESRWYTEEDEAVMCGNVSTALQCPSNYTCIPGVGPNPDYGYTNYDNIGWGLVMAFQILTMDYWENLYNKILSVMGGWYVLYFIPAIFFCSFYLLNLVLAVVALSYEREMRSMDHEDEKLKIEKRTAISYTADQDTIDTLDPIERHANNQLKAILAGRIDFDEGVKPRRRSQFLFSIGAKSTFKDAVIAKQMNFEQNRIEFTRWTRFQRHLCQSALHPAFEISITVCICINTIVLALYHHGIDPYFKEALDIINWIFTFIFVIEMTVKVVALGPYYYLQSKWNIFDGMVVILSVIDTAFELNPSVDGFAGTTMFRTFRLFRIMKLAQSWSAMGKLISTMAQSVGPLANITLILGLVIYIFAVLGTNIFGKAYTTEIFGEGEVPRWNFSDFLHSFMMVFRILCGEWIEPLWDCMRATNPSAMLFFLPAFIIGNFIILNLFLALLLNAFDSDPEEDDESENASNECEIPSSDSMSYKLKSFFKQLATTYSTPMKLYRKENVPWTEMSAINNIEPFSELLHNMDADAIDVDKPLTEVRRKLQLQLKLSKEVETHEFSNGELSSAATRYNDKRKRFLTVVEIPDFFPACLQLPISDSLCGVDSLWIHFRYKVRLVVLHKYFENLILFIIFASSFILVFEDVNLHKKPTLQYILSVFNILFAAVFTVEFVMKVVGLGIVGYFSSLWNCLDAFIVTSSWVGVVDSRTFSAYRSLRTLRAFRPLRFISRLGGMKVVVNALFAAFPGIVNVLLVCMMVWFIFSILGVQLFAGQFFKCVDADGNRLPASLVPNKTVCLQQNNTRRWINANVNFDNTVNGMLALFQVATMEGWMELMEDAVDARGVDLQPENESKFSSYLFFVLFIIVGAFFILNLFVGVIIDNFNKMKEKLEDDKTNHEVLLTETQRKWVRILEDSIRKPRKKTPRPKDPLRAWLFDIVTSGRFEVFILVVILTNMLSMMMKHYRQSPEISHGLKILNFVFTGIFVLEATVKIIALRMDYFKKAWSIFDFIIVITAILGITFDEMGGDSSTAINPSILRVIRVFRIGRLLRLIQFAKGIRQLLLALIISLPALFNIGTLLFLIIFIYAIVGMSTFGHIKKQGALDDVVNFETFSNSMLLLFRLSTAAGWNDILESLMVRPPDCDFNYGGLPGGNCGSPINAIAYLVSYVVIIFLIIVNMYIAVILENVNRTQENLNFVVTKDHFDDYYRKWSQYTGPRGKQYLPLDVIPDFVDRLLEPLRIRKPNGYELAKMDLPVYANKGVHCFALLSALVTRSATIAGESLDAIKPILARTEIRFKKQFKKKEFEKVVTSTKREFAFESAVITIQRALRVFLLKRQVARQRNGLTRPPNSQFADVTGRSLPTHGFVCSRQRVVCAECAARNQSPQSTQMNHASRHVESNVINNPLYLYSQSPHSSWDSQINYVDFPTPRVSQDVPVQVSPIHRLRTTQIHPTSRVPDFNINTHPEHTYFRDVSVQSNVTKDASTQTPLRGPIQTDNLIGLLSKESSVQTSVEDVRVTLPTENRAKLETETPDANQSDGRDSPQRVGGISTPSVCTACSSDVFVSEADVSTESFGSQETLSGSKQKLKLPESDFSCQIHNSKTENRSREDFHPRVSEEPLGNSFLKPPRRPRSASAPVEQVQKSINGVSYKNNGESRKMASSRSSRSWFSSEDTTENTNSKTSYPPADDKIPKQSLFKQEFEKAKQMLSRLMSVDERSEGPSKEKPGTENQQTSVSASSSLLNQSDATVRDRSRQKAVSTVRDKSQKSTSLRGATYKQGKPVPASAQAFEMHSARRNTNGRVYDGRGKNNTALYNAQPEGNEQAWSAWC